MNNKDADNFRTVVTSEMSEERGTESCRSKKGGLLFDL